MIIGVFSSLELPLKRNSVVFLAPVACGLIQRVNVGGFYQPEKIVNLACRTRALCQSKSRDWWLCAAYIWSVGVTLLVRA